MQTQTTGSMLTARRALLQALAQSKHENQDNDWPRSASFHKVAADHLVNRLGHYSSQTHLASTGQDLAFQLIAQRMRDALLARERCMEVTTSPASQVGRGLFGLRLTRMRATEPEYKLIPCFKLARLLFISLDCSRTAQAYRCG